MLVYPAERSYHLLKHSFMHKEGGQVSWFVGSVWLSLTLGVIKNASATTGLPQREERPQCKKLASADCRP